MKKKVLKAFIRGTASLIFWLAVWYLLAKKMNQEVLLPSPSSVFSRLWELLATADFYTVCFSSLGRILLGILSGVLCGAIFAVITVNLRFVDTLISPLLSVIKATPVASFIILAMLWIDRSDLPAMITFLIVFPVVWANVSEGIRATPKDLLEIAKVFKFSHIKKIFCIYLPSLIPFLISTTKSALGLAWKAGIAAEVLSVPEKAIGSQIYSAKIFLETTDLFAWTLVTIVLSVIVEKVVGGALEALYKKYS